MIVTGLTKLKLGTIFKDMPNVTLVTSNGLVYSWGANMENPECVVPEYPDDESSSPGKLQPNSSLAEFSSLTSGFGRSRANSLSAPPSAVPPGPNRCRADTVTSSNNLIMLFACF